MNQPLLIVSLAAAAQTVLVFLQQARIAKLLNLLADAGKAKLPPATTRLSQRLFKNHMHVCAADLPRIGQYDSAQSTIRDNCDHHAKAFVEVASDVIQITPSRTADTGEPIYTLRASDNREATLWCNKDGSVRSISPY